MRAKVRAMSSETRATTMILGGLPILVIVLLALSSPAYLVPLYTDVRGIMPVSYTHLTLPTKA